MNFTYSCKGTCSRKIQFEMDDAHIVTGIRYEGGCNGNLQGISSLCEGMKAEDLIKRLEGIRCGFKSTSCPDQLSHALKEALEKQKEAE